MRRMMGQWMPGRRMRDYEDERAADETHQIRTCSDTLHLLCCRPSPSHLTQSPISTSSMALRYIVDSHCLA